MPDTEEQVPGDPPIPPPQRSGFGDLREFLKARWDLLTIEWQEAKQLVARRLVALVAGFGILFFSAFLLLTALVSALRNALALLLPEEQAAWALPLAAGGLFLLFLLTGLVLLSRVKAKPSPPLFECTRAEWNKDQAWLQKKTSSNKKPS